MSIALLAALVLPATGQDEPRLTVSGSVRARYETLDGQFRSGRSGSDQLLLLRTLALAEYDAGQVTFGVEIQDSRTYLGDSGTPLSTSITNPLDVLQGYARMSLPGPFGAPAHATLGRQTVSIGSKRQIERVDYANVIHNYTGLHFEAADEARALHLIALVPLERSPARRADLDDNRLSGDEEQWNRLIWGAHYRHRPASGRTWAEAFVYGLAEHDTQRTPTPNRQYVTPGLRLYRPPAVGLADFDVEAALRLGSRRATNRADDTRDLDVFAGMAVIQLGYTFDRPWAPRLAAEYYYASGDSDPIDDAFDQYERLFGSRRTDLNNTSIHGPFTPANLSSPGMRLSGKPSATTDFWVRIGATSLASATDSWVVARLRDPNGQSGRFLGWSVDGRARWRPGAGRLEIEAGASVLTSGQFQDTVPGGPRPDHTLFAYLQATREF